MPKGDKGQRLRAANAGSAGALARTERKARTRFASKECIALDAGEGARAPSIAESLRMQMTL